MRDVAEPIGGQGSRAKTPVTVRYVAGVVSLASSAIAAVALVLLVLMFLAFGLGATSAGQTFGGINDALVLVAYILAVPGVLATAEMLRSRQPRFSRSLGRSSRSGPSSRSPCCSGSWSREP